APATNTDHLVELGPARKGIVRGVKRHETAAILHVFDERLLRRVGPLVAFVIEHNDIVFPEVRPKARHVGAHGGGRDLVDDEDAGLLEQALQDRAAQRPIVVAVRLSGEQHYLDPGARGGRLAGWAWRREGQQANKDAEGKGSHIEL